MWLNELKPIHKRDLVLKHPYVNAPGTLGFAPDPHQMPFLSRLGAFTTNPVSRKSRQPAGNRVCLPFKGGVLLHTGHPNPGIQRVISRNRHRWADAPLPIIVHLLAEYPETLYEMVRKLEGLENVQAVEIGIPPGCDSSLLEAFMEAASGELPLILSLSPQEITLLETVKNSQARAVHLAPPRGTLPNPKGELVSGRLYGPATFPILLQALKTVLHAQLDVIASGGVTTQKQAEILLNTGAVAVSLGIVLWNVHLGALFPEKPG